MPVNIFFVPSYTMLALQIQTKECWLCPKEAAEIPNGHKQALIQVDAQDVWN